MIASESIFCRLIFIVLIVQTLGWFLATLAEEPQEVQPLKVVYFIPNDRSPAADRQERLGRVMKNIQEFYRKGMEANGHGSKTFALEWETPEKLRLYDVRGQRKLTDYPKGTEGVVFREVFESLKQQGINMDQGYTLILGAWVHWTGDVAKEYGPYGGLGSEAAGAAFACEDELIDADLLASKEPGGYHYMIPDGYCSLGMFNTLYIGGIAHELGHTFGLPHDSELDLQRDTLGISIMGTGNHFYGKNLRGESPDAFLTAASAIRLSVCRAFDPDFAKHQYHGDITWFIENFDTSFENDKLILAGKSVSVPAVKGIIAYNDDTTRQGDYDAKTWVAIPDVDGNFRLEINELDRTLFEMRLVAVFPGGRTDRIDINYSNTSGTPMLEPFHTSVVRREINVRLDQRDWNKVAELLTTQVEKFPNNKTWAKKLQHLETIKFPPDFFEPDKVSTDKTEIDLTYAKALESRVGWYEPSRGILRECGFFEVDSTFFESGIYAHPASLYTFSIGKQWKEFDFKYGIQDDKPGSVVFVVRGDDKEMFRSGTVRKGEIRTKTLDVSDVNILELRTEDAGDGWANDWGLWLEPQLSR